ncbi:hypothetical protein Q8W71_30405 [Methylobacterium sp. NEAU 140]|uniref:hypothetical protein n=1 Tax=Methylobacterium sp. NEAU 140 TaxID=3064945 RepID=UPI002735F8E4|nr:hypothetical protein [Methylobacterium sp. NEAU 140]MDP4026907.1 hypothetical protein [Methylobacterium sp. NEAU 140]
MNTTKIASIAAAACLMSSQNMAQQSGGQENLKRHCTADYLEHCSQFSPGGPELQACFREKFKILSHNCSIAITAYQQEQDGMSAIKKISAAR